MPLILHHLLPIHWALGGAGIAAVTLTLLFVANRRLGISTSLEDLCSFVLPTPYFRRDAVLSPAASGACRSPSASCSAASCPRFSAAAGRRPGRSACSTTWSGSGRAGKLAWMFAGGLFIGFGTRLAGGCTSGHGIFGLSNFELAILHQHARFHGRRYRHHAARLPRRVRVRHVMTLLFVVLGTIFGFVLSRSGAADYNYIQSMFLFRSFSCTESSARRS